MSDAEKLSLARKTDPENMDRIRALCTKAEETAKSGTKATQQYVARIRDLYDDLDARGVSVPLTMESIETSDSSKIWWRVYLVDDRGEEREVGSSSDWEYPYEVINGWRKLSLGKELKIDFLHTSKVHVGIMRNPGLLYLSDYANPKWTIAELANGDCKLWTKTGTEPGKGWSYCVLFSGKRLRELWALRATVERLEDELFRKKRE